MLVIDRYQVKDRIHDGGWYQLFVAECAQHNRQVVLKYLADSHPSEAMLAGFRAEYHLLKQAAMATVIEALDLINHGRRLILVREYFPGQTLRDYSAGQALPIEAAYRLISELAETLAALHSQGIVHGNLNPDNILINTDRMQWKLIGFSRAKFSSPLKSGLPPPPLTKQTIDYLAPEQSGRMNRCADSRADIYALGVMLFELLIGRTPFESADALGLIHRHIAQSIPDPRRLRPQLPENLARIVLRMLAKDPNERYAKVTDVLSDLAICRQLSLNGNAVDAASVNGPCRTGLRISQRLYGRDAELAQLETALAGARENQSVLCLVTGHSGVGKSRLFEVFSRQSLPADCFFASAKCDQYLANAPTSLFYAAFLEVVQHLLGAHEETLNHWRQRLLDRLGGEAQAVIELLPELAMLLGSQPELPELPAGEAKIRLMRLWIRFVQTFCRADQPLCLFLDDLQWADPALFEWLERMLFDIKHLLLIGACRDTPAGQNDPLMLMTNRLRNGGVRIETITLTALPRTALTELINDTVTLDNDSAVRLCNAIYAKTQGNPLFFIHSLRKLQQDGVLTYHAMSGGWQYDNDKIHALGISDNVIDFMTKRMGALAEPMRELLKIMAGIGSAVDAELIGAVFGDHAAPQQNLAAAEASGLLRKLTGDSEPDKPRYVFAHDRVQQAAHSLCTQQELLVNRLKIGRYWANQARTRQDRQLLLHAIDHLNAAQTLIIETDEKRRLAADNFTLGLWAKHRGAFEQALPYLQQASAMLTEWLRPFGGLAAVLRHRAECEHLCGHHQQALQLFEQAVEIAGSDLEKARIFELMIQYYADLAQFDRAYRISRQAAALFDIDLPARFNRLAFLVDFLHLQFLLRKTGTDDLLALPSVSDAGMDIAIRLLSATLKVAYQLQPELCAAISLKQVRRALQYGNSPEAVIGYMVFGVIFLGGVLGNHQAGYDYGRLSLGLLDKYSNQRQKAEVNFVYGYFAHSWLHPASDTETYWRVALASGLESGDWFHSGCACCGLAQSQLMRGVPLNTIWHETETMLATLKRIDSREHTSVIRGIRQAIQNLRGQTDAADSFNAADFDEAAFINALAGYGSRHFAHYYYVNKMHCLYLWGEYDQALTVSRISESYLKDSTGMLHAVEHYFYTALILAGLYSELSRIGRYRALLTLLRTKKKLHDWARRCPRNFLSRYHLLTGEIHRLRRQPALAIHAYHKASGDAEANGQLHLEALANALLARLHKALGQERPAAFHVDEAAYCYRRWGATGYWHWFTTAHGQSASSKCPAVSPQGATHALDTVTLIKAAETIAAERRLPNLLQTLMHIVIENAGAQRGVLLLQEDEGLLIQAEAEIEADDVPVMQRLPLTAAAGLPQSVINFVSRSKETVVLENAVHSAVYGRDKAIAERGVRSLLCAPLLLRGELQGILYLENNAADAVFDSERVFLLQHLSGQIAISIDNAQGYLLLENKVAERTVHIETQKSALKQKNDELQARNATIEALNECLRTENRERMVTERELQKANIKLQRLATIDGLTQISNRRRFDDYLEHESRRLLRDNTPLSLILCDIDYFKAFNDRYGHQAGDDCLQKVARAIALALHRPTDLAARYGGEEFAVVMPHTDSRGAIQVAGLIRQAVIDLQIPNPDSQVADHLTLSVGIATAAPFHKVSPMSLIKAADNALYQVKKNGRNGIIHQAIA